MKSKLLTLLFCLCGSFTSFSQDMFSKTDSFKVVLQGSYSFKTGCGIMMFKDELKFKIIDTDYSFIGIATFAADLYGEFFS